MSKDIESILLANWYFTKCKIESPVSDKTELARKYLTQKVNMVLCDRQVSTNHTKSYSFK